MGLITTGEFCKYGHFCQAKRKPGQAPTHPTLGTNKQAKLKRASNVIKDGPLPLGMNEVERQML